MLHKHSQVYFSAAGPLRASDTPICSKKLRKECSIWGHQNSSLKPLFTVGFLKEIVCGWDQGVGRSDTRDLCNPHSLPDTLPIFHAPALPHSSKHSQIQL